MLVHKRALSLREQCLAMHLFYVGLAILSLFSGTSGELQSSAWSRKPQQILHIYAAVSSSNISRTQLGSKRLQESTGWADSGAHVRPRAVVIPGQSQTTSNHSRNSRHSRRLQLQNGATDLKHSKHSWFTTPLTRRRSLSVPGDRARMHVAVQKYASGYNISIAFVGGSITSGFASTAAAPNYVDWARIILHRVLGDKRMYVHNSGVSATGSSFMSVCHRRFIPSNADIIFLEYASELVMA